MRHLELLVCLKEESVKLVLNLRGLPVQKTLHICVLSVLRLLMMRQARKLYSVKEAVSVGSTAVALA